MDRPSTVRMLIKRLARIEAGEVWSDDLNPAQRAALEYLEQANRFSRAPSHVADYLGSTRGTVSQTLKALQRKGYLTEHRSETDKRSVSFDLTDRATKALAKRDILEQILSELPASSLEDAFNSLQSTLDVALSKNKQKPFGICRSCTFFERGEQGAKCALLKIALAEDETQKICHEHKLEQ